MTFLVLSVVSIAVIAILSLLDRNERRYYYFGIATIIAGLGLSFWSYRNSSVRVDSYLRKQVQIVSVSKREAQDTFVFETTEGDFLLPGAYLERETKQGLLSASWSNVDSTIWVSSLNSRIITGLETHHVKLHPESVAVLENLQNAKFVTAGAVISGVGFLIILLNYISKRLGDRENLTRGNG